MSYGKLPHFLGVHAVDCREFMFYQYLPVKMARDTTVKMEPRLQRFEAILGTICCDYVGFRGLDAFVASYVYVTAKRMFNDVGCAMNRPGYHSDGFLTDDINYIWSDCLPTVFNSTAFHLTLDDEVSMDEMIAQANPQKCMQHESGSLLRLDQYSIHRVARVHAPMMRTFLKVSFSLDRYDLIGNSHNHLLNYNWPMRPRALGRNIPNDLQHCEGREP